MSRRLPPPRLLLPALLLAACLASGACATDDVPEIPVGADGARDPVLVVGRRVYAERCANCHGNDGSGGRGSSLRSGAMIERYPDIADQAAVVADGVRAMPSFAEALAPSEIEAVVRFTREVL